MASWRQVILLLAVAAATLAAAAPAASAAGESDEWFADTRLEFSDSNDDGLNDTAIFHYQVDTDSGRAVEVDVWVDAYDNATGDWRGDQWDTLSVSNGSTEWRNVSFTARENGSYDFDLELEDSDENLEDVLFYDDIYLYANEEFGAWFAAWSWNLSDSDGDGANDTVTIAYDAATGQESLAVEVELWVARGDEWLDPLWQAHTLRGGENDSFTFNWSTDTNGTYDFYVDMYDEDDRWLDNFSFTGVALTAPGAGDGGTTPGAGDNGTTPGNGTEPPADEDEIPGLGLVPATMAVAALALRQRRRRGSP